MDCRVAPMTFQLITSQHYLGDDGQSRWSYPELRGFPEGDERLRCVGRFVRVPMTTVCAETVCAAREMLQRLVVV